MGERFTEPVKFYCRFCKGTSDSTMTTEVEWSESSTRRWYVRTMTETVRNNIRCCTHCGSEIEIWPMVHTEEKWIKR